MLQDYFSYIMPQVQYETDEDGRIFAYAPNYPEYITEWDNVEEARRNMLEVIEDIVLYKLQQGDKRMLEELRNHGSISYWSVYA